MVTLSEGTNVQQRLGYRRTSDLSGGEVHPESLQPVFKPQEHYQDTVPKVEVTARPPEGQEPGFRYAGVRQSRRRASEHLLGLKRTF